MAEGTLGERGAAAPSRATILDGRLIAARRQAQLAEVRAELERRHGWTPGFAVVQIGDHEPSAIYIRHKLRAAARVGIAARHVHLPAHITQADALAAIHQLNEDDSVDGIIIQLPVPEGLDRDELLYQIAPERDIDGLHPVSLGALFTRRGVLEPCTPRGVIRLLEAYRIDVRGKRAVVVGRSRLVGRPMAQMLVRANATVTVAHRFTQDLQKHVEQADIVVSATGVPHLIRGEWVRPGAVVVDVGISRTAEGKLVGDVGFDEAVTRAGWITPVPGGVGPMTVITLLENVLAAAQARRGLEPIPCPMIPLDDARA